MFIRTKHSGARTYLQLVENQRVDGKVRQHILHTLGRLDLLQESGQLDALLSSLQRFSQKLAAQGALAKGEVETLGFRHLGAVLIFERLWQQLGLERVLAGLLRARHFGFAVERVLFVTVLQRLLAPGSDRQAERWLQDYQIAGTAQLELQHFYRAMAWLGEPLPESEQDGATPFAPRCTKDLLEEALFARRRDLYTQLDLVFFDTTSIYFEGAGGESLGQYGHSKDHRADLKQMVVGAVLDNCGNPVCAELWPGNTADVSTLLPIAQRLRRRFQIGRICLVADRGMISAETMKQLVAQDWQYILGVRMRACKQAREEVLGRAGRYHEVTPERERSKDAAPLKVKEVRVEERRYIVCVNTEEARKDAHDREAILVSLREALQRGDKALVGNKGYRRYLKNPAGHFSIDEEKVAEEARCDGKWVLTTNTEWGAEEVALRYKQLWTVEEIFRSMKTLLETRPVYHKCDETIRGHVWCSYLALLLRKELQDRLDAAQQGEAPLEWADIIRDLEALGEVEVLVEGQRYLLRTKARPAAAKTFAACKVALPPTMRKG
jgi:transposase